MSFDPTLVIPAIVSLVFMTGPFDPVKVLFFNQAIANPPRNRVAAAGQVAINIMLILGGTALFGRQLLELLEIDLNAFRVVGGLMIGAIGIEMLYGGGGSKTNGESVREEGPGEDDALMIPLTMPLIAGPGAIATTMTLASQGDAGAGVTSALIAVAAVAAIAFVTFAMLGEAMTKVKLATMAVATRFGGLLMMTIGAQMFLGAVKAFFAG
jgi:multiple antibiotic resistance protein